MDEIELAEAAIFCLKQAAGRLRTLADQAKSRDLGAQLRAVAGVLDEHADDVAGKHRTPR